MSKHNQASNRNRGYSQEESKAQMEGLHAYKAISDSKYYIQLKNWQDFAIR